MESYTQWINSAHFRPLLKQHARVCESAANLFLVRQERACSDPATGDMTLQLMRRGSVRYELDFGTGRYAPTMRAGDFSLTPDNTPLHIEGEGRAEHLVLAMHGASLRAAIGSALLRPVVDLSPLHARLHRDHQIATALHWLWDEAQAGAPNGRLYADGVLTIITSRLAGLLGATRAEKGRLARWQVDRVTDYLRTDLSAQVTLAELAALVQLSEAHFCRSFKLTTGHSPLKWQLALRIEHAKALLSQPEVGIAAVAAACGYAQPSHFAKLFRRATGQPPAAWRRQHPS